MANRQTGRCHVWPLRSAPLLSAGRQLLSGALADGVRTLGGMAITCFGMMILATLLLTVRSGAQSAPADFAGYWLRDDGGVIKVSVVGNKVTAVHVKVVPENRDVYGFEPGDAHFEGIVQNGTMTGHVMAHLPVAKWKKLCPARWASWTENELTLSEDGKVLQGRWKYKEVSDKDCSILK